MVLTRKKKSYTFRISQFKHGENNKLLTSIIRNLVTKLRVLKLLASTHDLTTINLIIYTITTKLHIYFLECIT